MRSRLQEIQKSIERAHGHITSPADDTLLDICAGLLTEIAMLDAELSILQAGEGPTGCADDGDALGRALRGISQQDLNCILDDELR